MTYFKLLIYTHASLGTLALIAGALISTTKGGSKSHKFIGRIFTFSMSSSVLISMICALLPNHFNPFLLCIGLFTLFFLWFGFRFIQKRTQKRNRLDFVMNTFFVIVFLFMIIAPFFFSHFSKILTPIFGGMGLLLAFQNYPILLGNNKDSALFLKKHIAFMSGALISAVSAFLVVNNFFPFFVNWFLPSFLGALFIIFKVNALNRQTQKSIISLVFLTICTTAGAQIEESSHKTSREIVLKIGVSNIHVKDERLSAKTYKDYSMVYGLEFNTYRKESIVSNSFTWRSFQTHGSALLRIKSLQPNYNFSFQRRVGQDMFLGFFFNNANILNVPKSKFSLYENNPISYLCSYAIGPKISWLKPIDLANNKQVDLYSSLRISGLAYNIRPAFAHPYPSAFLKPDVFNPNKSKMASTFLKSGQIQTLKKFNNINFIFNLSYWVSGKIKIGIDYNLDWIYIQMNHKEMNQTNHDIMLSISYRN